MAYDQLDVLFKLSQQRRPTSSSKRVLEEVAAFAELLIGQQVWQATIDPDPAQAVLDGSVVLDSDLVLNADPTTPTGEENSVWLTGQIDYVPRNVVPGDLGFTTVIKDNALTAIPDGKLDEFGVLFLHVVGVLLVQDPAGFAAEYSFPPRLTAYRYVGVKGLPQIPGEVDGGAYLDLFNAADDIDGGTYV